jgi:hypothetical protein
MELCKECFTHVEKVMKTTGKCIPCTDKELEQIRSRDIEENI